MLAINHAYFVIATADERIQAWKFEIIERSERLIAWKLMSRNFLLKLLKSFKSLFNASKYFITQKA